MSNKIISAAALAGFVLLTLNSCHTNKSKGTEKTITVPVVETVAVSRDKLSTQLQLPGELVAFQQVDIYAKVTSFVKDLKVDIGSQVKEGQLLMLLEAPELSAQLAAAESRLKSLEAVYSASKSSYNRLLETSKVEGAVSPNDLDIAQAKQNSDLAQLEAAKASFKEAGVLRNYLEIRAPFNGVITARNVNPGAYVGPSGKGSELPLLTLQEQGKLRLAVSIPEAYTGYLKQDGEVTFKVRSLPAQVFKARIKRMSGALDLRLRSERVEMDIVNKNNQLLPGSVAEVTIPLSALDSTYIVPKSAVVSSDEGVYVIRVVDKKAERIPVQKGREAEGRLEVFGNLTDSDVLVLKASEEIKEGSQVNSK